MKFKKQNGTEFKLNIKNCVDEIEQTINKKLEVTSVCIKKENDVLLVLNIEKNCLGVICETLKMFGITIEKA